MGWLRTILTQTEFRLVSGNHFMPVWLSDRSHVNKIVPVWVCTSLMKSGRYCPWVSEDVVKHSWELHDFRLRCVYMIFSMIFILVQVPPDFLLFFCICLMITAQNLITVQVIPVWACAPVVVLGHNYHCGTETNTWYNCLIHSALSFNPLTIKNKSYITVARWLPVVI